MSEELLLYLRWEGQGRRLRQEEIRRRVRGLEMSVVITSMLLVCAVLASLALGVLVAYGICQAMFRIFRVHAISAAKNRVTTQEVQVVSQG